MKNFILILFLLLAIPGFTQKKKQIEAKDAQIDTLTKANAALLAEVDSISADHKVYYGLYTTIKEKVLMEDFDPARFPEIVDSISCSQGFYSFCTKYVLQRFFGYALKGEPNAED